MAFSLFRVCLLHRLVADYYVFWNRARIPQLVLSTLNATMEKGKGLTSRARFDFFPNIKSMPPADFCWLGRIFLVGFADGRNPEGVENKMKLSNIMDDDRIYKKSRKGKLKRRSGINKKRRIRNQLLLTSRNRRRFASCSCRWPDDEATGNNSFPNWCVASEQLMVVCFCFCFLCLLYCFWWGALAKSFLVDHRHQSHRYLSSCSCLSCLSRLFQNYTAAAPIYWLKGGSIYRSSTAQQECRSMAESIIVYSQNK